MNNIRASKNETGSSRQDILPSVEPAVVPVAVPPRPGSTRLVVHVVRQFFPSRGGLEDVVLNLCRENLKAGYRVRVVTLDSVFAEPGLKLKQRELIGDIEVIRIGWRGTSRYPLAPSVISHLNDADIVHVHAIDFFFDALALAWLAHRKPMVVTTHGGFFHTRKYQAIKTVWFRTLTRLSASAYHKVICCSRSDFERFSEIAPSRVALIENGADVDKFRGAASAQVRQRIVSVSRFSINKRLDRLIEMMACLKNQAPGWHLDIVGFPSDQDQSDLEVLVEKSGVGDVVSIHAGIDNKAIAGIMANASFLASASDYEGFGLVAIEAMSAGLLPVLNDNDAFRSLAAKHSDLMLTDFSSPQRAADTVLDGYRLLSENSQLIRARMLTAAENYCWDKVAGQYHQLYAGCLSKEAPA